MQYASSMELLQAVFNPNPNLLFSVYIKTLHFSAQLIFKQRSLKNTAMAAILLLFLTLVSNSKADRDFDVRQHLSTVTRSRFSSLSR